jgi:3-oxoacyl-[acyl-carrier protein] reductase
MKLADKVALVSGSGRGIGKATALKLAREGALLVVNDLDGDCCAEVIQEISALGGQAVACVGSVTDADFGERFVDTAIRSYGRLDIIVNNAGYAWDGVVAAPARTRRPGPSRCCVTRKATTYRATC